MSSQKVSDRALKHRSIPESSNSLCHSLEEEVGVGEDLVAVKDALETDAGLREPRLGEDFNQEQRVDLGGVFESRKQTWSE